MVRLHHLILVVVLVAQLVARYGISYEGGNNFISAADRGGSENGLAAANFIIPTVLNEFNNMRSQVSDEALRPISRSWK